MNEPVPVRFDESLPILVNSLREELGEDLIQDLVVVRDASGRLAAFVKRELDESLIALLTKKVRDRLGAYARPDRVFAHRNAPGAERIFDDAEESAGLVSISDDLVVQVLDRRVVATDWLGAPAPAAVGPPRLVFASLKGGCGTVYRSGGCGGRASKPCAQRARNRP